MWADLALTALSAVKNVVAYTDEVAQNESDRKWQAFNNAMVEVQNAGNQNVLTDNENLAREKAAQQSYSIKGSAYKTKASVEVAAAASGTAGRSVDIALYDVGRSEALALDAVQKDMQVQWLGFDNQRRQSAVSAKLSHDFKGLPGPNPATYMLGFATDVANIQTK